MSRISEIGDQILKQQFALGLNNPTHYNPGLSEGDRAASGALRDVFRRTELTMLYAWRDGVVSDTSIPMSDLWLIPGFFLLRASAMEQEAEYFSLNLEGWKPNWYPLLSDGTGDRLFVDSRTIREGLVPVFCAFWESSKPHGKIYDSIASMMETILECYRRGVYYVDTDGGLNRNLHDEAEIAQTMNPESDYWRRTDLVL